MLRMSLVTMCHLLCASNCKWLSMCFMSYVCWTAQNWISWLEECARIIIIWPNCKSVYSGRVRLNVTVRIMSCCSLVPRDMTNASNRIKWQWLMSCKLTSISLASSPALLFLIPYCPVWLLTKRLLYRMCSKNNCQVVIFITAVLLCGLKTALCRGLQCFS